MARSDGMRSLRFGTRIMPGDRALVLAAVYRTRPNSVDRPIGDCLAEVDEVLAEGADIVQLVDPEGGPEEWLVPLLTEIRSRHPDAVVGVHVSECEAADQACIVGADLVAGADPGLGEIATRHGVGMICSSAGPVGRDPVETVALLSDRARQLVSRGVPEYGILIDPSFGRTSPDKWELVRRLDEMVQIEWPLLLTSPDDTAPGRVMPNGPAVAFEGALAAMAIAAAAGVRVFRSRHVRAARRVVEMAASITGTRPPARALRALS